ncbi:MAG TPA: Stp1/IreP family PP2C-type Ser/Thr phosphatase [Candidatus Binataceae bacterium]|nr:Stp1/IreP family PP2C-type Ser/Thr phosphatase [Candidatus Binataceae bacterium]
MINCPQCGQSAPDDTKFCDRCGQSLTAAATAAPSLAPLALGSELKGGSKIVELLRQSSNENRYRASRERDGKTESFQLREQIGPTSEPPEETTPQLRQDEPPPQPAEDPAGPRAKTAELRVPRSATEAVEAVQASAAEEKAPEIKASADDSLVKVVESDNQASPSPSIEDRADADSANSAPIADDDHVAQNGSPVGASAETQAQPKEQPTEHLPEDLGELFGRVMSLSLTLKYPAFQCALEGFADKGRVYLVYADENLTPLSRRRGGIKMREGEALNVAIQLCQAIAFLNKRALRLNDICPESLAYDSNGRLKIISLDYVSNDNELQAEPILNDGYTAPEIYRGKKVDKRADIFSAGALLYACLTGDRIASESWREETGPLRPYPPHVISPKLERVLRRALAFQPADRWPTADAFKAELLQLGSGMTLRTGALTDVGMVRELNEDSFMVVEYERDSQVEPAEHFLYVVSDGMGGAEAGEVASALAVGAIREYVEKAFAADSPKPSPNLIQEAVEEANRRVQEYQVVHPETRGMGATAVAVLITPPEASLAWVGDSRIYLCDVTSLRQLTKDHSLVQRLIEIGQITPDQARHHEHKNVITRSLGARQSGPAGAEMQSLRLKRGDRLLLCSDGLMAHVEDQEIEQILRRHDNPVDAARELVVAANAGGGTDNTTVIVVSMD